MLAHALAARGDVAGHATDTAVPDAPGTRARAFLAELRAEVESHPGVVHPLLMRLGHVPFTREDYRVMGLQHYALVGNFTWYLEQLLIKAPDSEAKQWIAKVLVNEYGEGSEGKDHAELYRGFLLATGAAPGEELTTPLAAEVTGFIDEHRRICRQEPFLTGLGALGPGHEWSIPRMFRLIVRGLRRAGFEPHEILYFTLHQEQDIDHGLWLEEALARYARTDEARAQIRRGAQLSLEARARFWSAVQAKIVRWRQPKNTHLRSQSSGGSSNKGELTLGAFRARSPSAQGARGA
jgi:pyrroloquinoline quinone (PQQ) biosynthesis protein C